MGPSFRSTPPHSSNGLKTIMPLLSEERKVRKCLKVRRTQSQRRDPTTHKGKLMRENPALRLNSIWKQFNTGRLYACISSRPGQSGRCDGYLLEGKELDFYLKKIRAKRKVNIVNEIPCNEIYNMKK